MKTDDFVHWYKVTEKATEDACAGIRPAPAPEPTVTDESADTTTAGGGYEACDPCPSFMARFGAKDAESQMPLETDEANVQSDGIDQNEQLILNHLRSNPSLVEPAFSVSSMNGGKRGDQPSTGSKTQNESFDGDEVDEEPKKKGYGTRFIICMTFAAVLAILLIGLVVALLADRTKAFRLNQNPVDTGSAVDTTDSGYTSIDGENDAGNNIDTVDGQNSTYAINSDSNTTVGEDVDEIITFDYTANSNYLVGVYYYPWYSEDFHRGAGYLRRDLIPQQQPVLGEYDDSNPEVIEQHLRWFRQANIGLLVTSWWGSYSIEDNTTKNVIMDHEDIGNLKIALHFETKGRIKNNTDMSVPREDIQYMCDNYFDHDNYYKIDGRPVIVVHVTRLLHSEGILEEAILTMRSEANKCGKNLYIIGDQVFESAPDPEDTFTPFWYFDAVTNFDVYGSSGRPNGFVGREAVDNYYAEQAQWKQQALEDNCQYIPPVSPGYNDRSVRLDEDHVAMSRRLSPIAEEGSLFWYQLKQALPLVSPEVDNLILVNSFNQFHEDTQIEPVMSAVPAGVATIRPPYLTGGLEYAAYGELYLDLLGAATSKNSDEQDFFDQLFSN